MKLLFITLLLVGCVHPSYHENQYLSGKEAAVVCPDGVKEYKKFSGHIICQNRRQN